MGIERRLWRLEQRLGPDAAGRCRACAGPGHLVYTIAGVHPDPEPVPCPRCGRNTLLHFRIVKIGPGEAPAA